MHRAAQIHQYVNVSKCPIGRIGRCDVVDVAGFDFDLPDELIAQQPPITRGDSRLLVLHRDGRDNDESTKEAQDASERQQEQAPEEQGEQIPD